MNCLLNNASGSKPKPNNQKRFDAISAGKRPKNTNPSTSSSCSSSSSSSSEDVPQPPIASSESTTSGGASDVPKVGPCDISNWTYLYVPPEKTTHKKDNQAHLNCSAGFPSCNVCGVVAFCECDKCLLNKLGAKTVRVTCFLDPEAPAIGAGCAHICANGGSGVIKNVFTQHTTHEIGPLSSDGEVPYVRGDLKLLKTRTPPDSLGSRYAYHLFQGNLCGTMLALPERSYTTNLKRLAVRNTDAKNDWPESFPEQNPGDTNISYHMFRAKRPLAELMVPTHVKVTEKGAKTEIPKDKRYALVEDSEWTLMNPNSFWNSMDWNKCPDEPVKPIKRHPKAKTVSSSESSQDPDQILLRDKLSKTDKAGGKKTARTEVESDQPIAKKRKKTETDRRSNSTGDRERKKKKQNKPADMRLDVMRSQILSGQLTITERLLSKTAEERGDEIRRALEKHGREASEGIQELRDLANTSTAHLERITVIETTVENNREEIRRMNNKLDSLHEIMLDIRRMIENAAEDKKSTEKGTGENVSVQSSSEKEADVYDEESMEYDESEKARDDLFEKQMKAVEKDLEQTSSSKSTDAFAKFMNM